MQIPFLFTPYLHEIMDTIQPGTIDYLAKLNYHPRDENITFEPEPHIYTVNGDRGGYTSVTTWNHEHFTNFDTDGVITNILNGSKWANDPDYAYYKMTREEMRELWHKNAKNSSDLGTELHNDIEKYYNGMDVPNQSVEYGFFKLFLKDFDLKPYRTEWMIYHEEMMLTGTVDMLYENPDGTLQIYDWKRSKEIKFETYNNYSKTPCISHLPNTNFWHYSLQLNMYRTILEQKYEKQITDMYLVIMHPDYPYKTYQRIEVPFLRKEMDNLVELRLKQVDEAKSK